ncbi:protein Wnt-8b [Leucoraja erinacea]|uniref:protein Wnt-8b n=1 Tax=Leucoraja erinaceus TaxID=7782 RepID=UPI0024587280|nr:protein Wnt-8b [Leucoraja erinacea]
MVPRDTVHSLILLTVYLKLCQAWSVNNFLMTGPKIHTSHKSDSYLFYDQTVYRDNNGQFPIGIFCVAFYTGRETRSPLEMTKGDQIYTSICEIVIDSLLQAYLIYSSSVAAGAQSGIEECKHQFAWDRWNCPERALQLSTHSGLRSANREAAFVHAISSAGVMYTLTRNCSLGDFDNCGCDDSRNGQLGGHGWLWGGCSDNVGFGETISKQFVDALETGQDARAAMNLHNNEAGRKAVKGTMKQTCKCHGVSGSCTTQTCWLQLPEFREVGNYLKEKYHKALKVDLLKGAGNSAASRGAIAETFSAISKKELVHLEDSPDYCLENKTLGLQGTEGRECIKKGKHLSKWEKRSCKRLCGDCGLAVGERRAQMMSSCNCKFHWCCAVKCEQCRKTITKYFCVKKDKKSRNESASKRKGARPARRQ